VEPKSVSPIPNTINLRGNRRALEREWEQGTCQLVGMFVGSVENFGFWSVAK